MRAILLTATIPIVTLLAFFLPYHRLLDPVMMPLQAFFVGLFIYHLGLVTLGVRAPEPVKMRTPRSQFAIAVAAHNEEAVVGNLIASLSAQNYPRDLVTIFVAADHCTDRTAEVARVAGARAFERHNSARRGKGPAIEWLIGRIRATGEPFDAVVIFDADNLAAPTFLRYMDAYLQEGHQVIQGYLGVKNPDDSWITRAIHISYAYTNRFFQLAKRTIGLSSALGGTGLCIAAPLLERLGWRCEALTEDLEFQIRAILEGVRPTWAWEAVVYDEKPLTFQAAWQQRRRWMQGHASVAVRYLGPLIGRAITTRDPIALDTIIYLSGPIWLSLAFLLAIVYLANQLAPLFSYMYPAWIPPLLIVVSCVYPYVALQLEGVPTRGYLWPSTLAGVLALSICWPLLGFLGLLQHRNRVWVKTSHTRSLSLAEVEAPTTATLPSQPRWKRLSIARATAGAMIALVIISVLTPQIVARRLRPPLEEGATFLLDGRTAQALERFQDALNEQPQDPVAEAFLAVTYRMMGNQLPAMLAYRRLKALDPTLEQTTVAVVDFWLRHRDHPNSEQFLHDLLSTARSGPDAYVWTANLFINRGRLRDADTIVAGGLRRFGRQVPLLKVRGFLLLKQNRPADAILVLEEARSKAPNDVFLMTNLGWAYYYAGNIGATIRIWERALTLDPANEALRNDLERIRRRRAKSSQENTSEPSQV